MKTEALNVSGADAPIAVQRLQRFRGELAEFAFSLEMQRKLDAADAVNAIAARVAEIESELLAANEAEAP